MLSCETVPQFLTCCNTGKQTQCLMKMERGMGVGVNWREFILLSSSGILF